MARYAAGGQRGRDDVVQLRMAEGPTRDVDGHRQPIDPRRRSACRRDRPAVELDDQALRLGDVDEVRGFEEAMLWMRPPRQSFNAPPVAIDHVDEGLEVQLEVLA